MFRSLRAITILICLTLIFSSMYAVKKNTKKSKTPAPIVEKVAEPAVVRIPQADILAEYDGGIITKQDLENKIAKLPQQSQSRFKTVEGQTQILDMMTVEDVFFQKAKDMNLLTDPGVMEKNNAAKKQILLQEYYKRNVTDTVKLSEAEKQSFYEQNKKEFYNLPNITIKYLQPADEQNALKAMSELKKGVAFDSVAAHYSINKLAKNVNWTSKNITLNGNLPIIGADPALEDIIRNAKADATALIGPNQTKSGWSIIQVLDKIDGSQRPYLECEAEIDQRLRPRKEGELMNKLVDKLKTQYKVVVDSTTLAQVDLREPIKNKAIEDKRVVNSSDESLNMTVKTILDKFAKMSPQEQMMYVKGDGAKQIVTQEITRTVLYLAAQADKSLDGFLATNDDYKQTERYSVLQEVYKKLVVDEVKVSSVDTRNYYDTHLDTFTTPSARKILAIWPKDAKTAKTAYKKFAKAVKSHNQKALADIIKKYSVKPEQDSIDNIYNNGVIVGIGPDNALADLVWSTPVGKVSPITQTAAKKDIIFFSVIEERPPLVKSFVESEPRIMGQLKRDKEKAQMETVKEQLFTQYGMKKYPEKLVIKLTADELFEMADASARQRKFQDTILYYNQIIQFYPNGTDDYKASFMKAFLISEEMDDKAKGLTLFKEFIAKYPKGDLNESAQYMIDELEGKHQQLDDIQLEDGNK